MEQPGENEGYSVNDHLEALEKHSYKGIADVVIANNAPVPDELKSKYLAEYANQVVLDSELITTRSRLLEGNLVLVQDGQIRHNFSRLARVIINIKNLMGKD